MALSFSEILPPMEARTVSSLPRGKNWRYEPKWDGFRCLAYKKNGRVILRSRGGKPLERYFPDIAALLSNLKAEQFVLDGELVIDTGSGYSFSELQLRLHPAASRVKKLAAALPASYIVFDMLMTPGGKDILDLPLTERRRELEEFYKRYAVRERYIALSPQTSSAAAAKKWALTMGGQLDGLIAKDADDIYQPAGRRMQKYKFIRTADCVVGGFRYGKNSPLVGSLLLGLYDDRGLLNHVGFTSSLAAKEKPDLTAKLEKLAGGSGFTGKAPGGPSRWSTERTGEWVPLKPSLVAEVAYDHVSDGRFRHGTRFIRWRPDKKPRHCRMEQILQPAAEAIFL